MVLLSSLLLSEGCDGPRNPRRRAKRKARPARDRGRVAENRAPINQAIRTRVRLPEGVRGQNPLKRGTLNVANGRLKEAKTVVFRNAVSAPARFRIRSASWGQ